MNGPDHRPFADLGQGAGRMYALICTRYLGKHFVLREGSTQGIQVPTRRFDELRRAAAADERVPDWLSGAARRLWNIDVASQPMTGAVLVRPDTRTGTAARATSST